MHREANTPVVFYKIGPDGDELKYVVNARELFIPIILKTYEDLQNYPAPYILIMEVPDYKEIPKDMRDTLKVVSSGKLGHSPCIALMTK